MEQRFIETKNGRICYFLDRNDPNRPTLVFLHGLSANHTTWLPAAQTLGKLGFNCLLLDLRGHGHSDKTKKRDLYRLPIFTQDLKEIIKKENLPPAILVSYSFGGFVALDFAVKYPDQTRGLILISANHVNALKYKHLNWLTWPLYGAVNLLAWLFSWQKRKKYYYFNQETDIGYWRSALKGYLTMPISVNFWLLAQIAYIDFSRDLEKIKCPALLIRSQSDPFLSQKEINDMARKIKSAKTVVLNAPSHFLASRHQEKILEEITGFLKEFYNL